MSEKYIPLDAAVKMAKARGFLCIEDLMVIASPLLTSTPPKPVTVVGMKGMREKQIAAMAVELEKHPKFIGESTKAVAWASRLFDAALAADKQESP